MAYERKLGAQGLSYVDRGDPSSADFTESSGLTVQDGTWTDVSLAAIIPAAAYGKPIHIGYTFTIPSGSRNVKFRTNGASNTFNIIGTEVVAGPQTIGQGMIKCDSSGVIEYRISASVTTATLTVLGWWI